MEPDKLVARFRDGKIQKGYCLDFDPEKPEFHLLKIESDQGEEEQKVFLIQNGFFIDFARDKPEFHPLGKASGPEEQGQKIFLKDLKALFFVKHFEGIPARQDSTDFSGAPPQSGRRVEVIFTDGERLVGTTTGYDPQRPGFFLFPADPQSNNIRVFIVTSAVKSVQRV